MGDLVKSLLADLPTADVESAGAVRERASQVLRPLGALERLDEIAIWLASWQRRPTPRVDTVNALVFAADHGVAVSGVSAYPPEVTEVMLRALRGGVATASVMSTTLGVELSVIDVGVGRPTGDITREPALTSARFDECWGLGREAVSAIGRPDLLVVGEMGIGNTTAAAAVCAGLFGGDADLWTGRGTGIDDASILKKKAAVDTARQRVEEVTDPFEVLRQVGGSELVALAAAVTEARIRSIPVVLDGFVVSAACAVLEVARPGSLEHTVAGHCSAELGHRLLLDKLGQSPVLDLGMRLGEASGGLAAVPLIRLAARCVTDVGTFGEWGLTR
jgi:nicotinate-nucleotide--dimethylbenzimidazole phosphoribosyltransferase